MRAPPRCGVGIAARTVELRPAVLLAAEPRLAALVAAEVFFAGRGAGAGSGLAGVRLARVGSAALGLGLFGRLGAAVGVAVVSDCADRLARAAGGFREALRGVFPRASVVGSSMGAERSGHFGDTPAAG